MKNETARREIESLDYYLQNHTNDYSEESHTAMMLAIDALSKPQEPKTEWIPLKTRPMTEEETECYFEYMDIRIDDTYTILDCPLPDDGEEVLVSLGGLVYVDTFVKDSDGCYFEGVDIDDVEAWQPLPEAYKAESEHRE